MDFTFTQSVGLLAYPITFLITDIVSETLNINIQRINISGEDGIFEGDLAVSIKNKGHLNTLIQKIMTLEGVQSVKRIYKT